MQGRRDIGTKGRKLEPDIPGASGCTTRKGALLGGTGFQPVQQTPHTPRRCAVTMIATMVLAISAPVRAIDVTAETWTGDALQGQWLGVGDGNVRIESRTEGVKTLTLDALMRATFDVSAPTSTGPPGTTIFLADGAVLFGKVVGATDDSIEADCRWAGRVTLPIKSLAAVRFAAPAAASPQEAAFRDLLANRPADRDVLIASAGDTAKTARGVLQSLTETSISFRWNDQTLNVSHDRCYAIVLARGVDRPTTPAATMRLRDDAVLAGDILDGDNATLGIHAPFAKRIDVPLREISQIAWHNPNVSFATTLEPTRYDFTPYLYGEWTWRVDRSAMNTPIRLDGRAYERGIGMRCGGSLTFATNGQYAVFAATIGIDDAVRPRGEVIFRVLADDNEVFNSGPVTGLENSRRVSVDVSGAKTVTLVVDVGTRTDVGGCADWADARFIRGATQ